MYFVLHLWYSAINIRLPGKYRCCFSKLPYEGDNIVQLRIGIFSSRHSHSLCLFCLAAMAQIQFLTRSGERNSMTAQAYDLPVEMLYHHSTRVNETVSRFWHLLLIVLVSERWCTFRLTCESVLSRFLSESHYWATNWRSSLKVQMSALNPSCIRCQSTM